MPDSLHSQPSAATHLETRTDRHLMVVAVCIAMGFLLWFLFYSLGKQQIEQLKLVQKEIETTFVSDQSLTQINQYVDANIDTLLKVSDFFPNETNIIATLEAIESLAQKYDPSATVKITSTQPVPKDNQLQIPLVIVLNTSLEGLTKLLREIEKTPLILEIGSINILHTSANNLQINLGVSLYVDDPFVPAP